MGLGSLLIRADANREIGTGHVMRCLALAQAWIDAGGSAWLAAADSGKAIATLLATDKIRICQLSSPAASDEDARETAALSRELRADFVVVDGFHFTAGYVSVLRHNGAPVLLIDDHATRASYDADVILNPNIFATRAMYSSHKCRDVLAGPQFALLRREFRQNIRHTHTDSKTIELLITLGGSDPDNITLRILEALNLVPHPLNVTVVSGSANPHLDCLRSFVANAGHHTRVLVNINNMAELIRTSDAAISAAGVTACELAALGTPMLLITIAENHAHTAEEFERQGMARSLGWHHRYDARALSDQISEFLQNKQGMAQRAAVAAAIIDAKGTERVVTALLKRELFAHA